MDVRDIARRVQTTNRRLSADIAATISGEVEEKLVFRGHTSLVTTVKRLLEGRQAASCSYDKTIRIWDTATAECVLTLTGHAHIIYGMPPPSY